MKEKYIKFKRSEKTPFRYKQRSDHIWNSLYLVGVFSTIIYKYVNLTFAL